MSFAKFCTRCLLGLTLGVPAAVVAEPPGDAEGDGKAAAAVEPGAEEASAGEEPEAKVEPATAERGPTAVDVSARMDALMDRMVRARTRLSALGEALYRTRVRITLDHRVEGFRVERIRLFLDGAPVHDGDGAGLSGGDDVELFTGFAAPGMHDLRLEVVQVSHEDGRYGYTLEQRFRFRAVEDQRTMLQIRMDDDSDEIEDFEEDRDGEYDVRTRLQVRSEPVGDD